MAGDAAMNHHLDYLNHTWDPRDDARRFEYSTLPWEHLVSIETVLEEVFLRYGIEEIAAEVFRLQDQLLKRDRYGPPPSARVPGPPSLRDPVRPDRDERRTLGGSVASGRDRRDGAGQLPTAGSSFLSDDEEMERVADALSRLA